jgi:tetratricopeptide (TPR) repeat protein
LDKVHKATLAFTLLLCLSVNLVSPCDARSERGKGHVLPSEEQYDIGIKKYKGKDYEGAVDAFKQSIYFARNEYMPQSWYWLGVTYMVKLEDTKAIEAFKKYFEQAVGPTWEAHIHLGHIYLRNNRLAEAEDEARNALAAYQGQCPKAYNLYGLVSKARNEYDGAVGWFLQALGERPWTYTEAWMNYADMLMWAKRWPAAIEQFSQMLESERTLKGLDEETLYTSRGKCLLALGDHQRALEDFHRTLIKEYKEFCRTCNEQKRTSAVMQRIAMLEQMLQPTQAAPQAPAPSAYMRQQQQAEQKQEEQQQLAPHESGF